MTNLVKFTTDDVQAASRASNASPAMALSELFAQWHYKPVFSENLFERSELASADFHVILDRLGKGKEQISVAYIRGCNEGRIALTFEQILFRDDTCLIVADEYDWQYLVVFPIFARKFDEHGRISREERCRTTISVRQLIVQPPCNIGCSYSIFRARDLLSLMEPNRYNIERRPFAIYGEHNVHPFVLSEYMIGGKIYDPRWRERVGNKKVCQEQVAYLLYHYYGMLAKSTDKSFYRAVQTMIAYAVALRLCNDGLFLHGEWTDDMETHWRYEAEGLQLLTKHHQRFGGERIEECCRWIAKCIRKHGDDLGENGLWFLHDTLENSPQVALGYSTLLPSRAFGKDTRNTFALNTHLCSLIALASYADAFEDAGAQASVKAGLEALQRVLSARTGGDLVFSMLYAVYNGVFHRQWRIWRVIRRQLSRLLLRAKKTWPRLVMPNGAIERDLSASAFSRRYHAVNLKDLLKLRRIREVPGIENVILQGLYYAIKADFARGDMRGHPGGKYWSEVLLACIAIQNDVSLARKYLQLLLEYRDILTTIGAVWPVDMVSELEPGDSWHAAMRDLPVNNDLFAFCFKGKQHWVLLGEMPDVPEFCARAAIPELFAPGILVFLDR